MVKLESVSFGNGAITYNTEIKPQPRTETSEKQGNATVTVINEAKPGVPAHYEVTFMLNAKFESDELKLSNIFHWNCIVPETDHHASYRSVEDRAARQIPQMLREIAQRIEAELPDFDPRVGEAPDKEQS